MPNFLTQGPAGPAPSVQRLPPARGRDFFVGDIHGAFGLVVEALTRLSFDPRVDRLICAGDLVDRGDQSTEALEFLREPWVFAVRGNHEQMLLDGFEPNPPDGYWAQTSIDNGGGWFLKEPVDRRVQLLRAFRALPLAIEIPTPQGLVGVIHAEVPVSMSWDAFTRELGYQNAEVCESAIWGRIRVKYKIGDAVPGVWRIFCGHTIRAAMPRWQGNICFADTGGYRAWRDGPGQGFALSVINILAPQDVIASAGQDAMLTLVDA